MTLSIYKMKKYMTMFLQMGHATLQKQNATIKTRDVTLNPILILENKKNKSITRPN
jgi:hypothetical protein